MKTLANVKSFDSISEWLKSNPSKEETTKILEIINRKSLRALKEKAYFTQRDMRRLNKLQENLKKDGFPQSVEITTRVKEMEHELMEIQRVVGTPKPRVKKEPKVEPKPKAEAVAETKESDTKEN